jgi:pimeloyl-ACP methyl ester carboxylesterase
LIGLDALHGAPAHAGRKDGDRPDPSRRVYEEAVVRDYAGRGPTLVRLNGFPDNSHTYDAANHARLEDFRRLQAPIQMIWGRADAYLNVGVAEDPAIAGEECLASPDPSRALAAD